MRVLCRVAALVFALAACSSFEGQPVCGGEEVELPRANCPEAVEEAIGAVVPGTSVLFEPSPREASGEHLGRVLQSGERRLVLELLGEERLLLWPEPLPFVVKTRREFLAQIDESSVTLFFQEGALAFFHEEREEPRGAMRIGELEARWERGCDSRWGPSLNLAVGEVVLAPGETAEVGTWRVRHLGAVDGPLVGCAAYGFQAAWYATSTKERYFCESTAPTQPCEPGTSFPGMHHDFGVDGITPGAHEVVSVAFRGFTLREAGSGSTAEFRWPTLLPVRVFAGDEVVVEDRNGWRVLSLPSGEFAVFRDTADSRFSAPPLGPDGTTPIHPVYQCRGDDGTAVMGVVVGEGPDEIRLAPGLAGRVGGWTYHLVFGWEGLEESCYKGERLYRHVDGQDGGGVILAAYRTFGGYEEEEEEVVEEDDCEPPPLEGPACAEEILEADARGHAHDFGLRAIPDGTYEVVSVRANGFELRAQQGEPLAFAWHRELPLQVSIGDEVVVETPGEWHLLTLPRGQLAVWMYLGIFYFRPPSRGPDGVTQFGVRVFPWCLLDEHMLTRPVILVSSDGSVEEILPGESAVVGEWTYELVYARMGGGGIHQCADGTEVISEGWGEGKVVAYRAFAPSNDPAND